MGWAPGRPDAQPVRRQDEENFRIWAINWDLLVNFSPDDLSPVPGIAESWEVSPDKKTVTFKLIEGAKWSDGEPITSKDVKYSLDKLGTNGLIFTGYTSNVTSVETPDDHTVVIKTKQPDARIIGGLFIYMIPEHVYGKVPLKQLTRSFQPPLPMVGSGPYVVTEFERGRIVRMERNPNFRGEQPAFDEIQFIKYGTADAVERALRLGEIDAPMEARAGRASTSSGRPTASRPSRRRRRRSPSSPSTCARRSTAPTRSSTRRSRTGRCGRRSRTPSTASASTRSPPQHLVPRATACCPSTTRPGTSSRPTTTRTTRTRPTRCSTTPARRARATGRAQKGDVELSFDLFVRSESPQNIQAAKLVAEQAREIGVDFKVQVVSVDKLTEITTRRSTASRRPTSTRSSGAGAATRTTRARCSS